MPPHTRSGKWKISHVNNRNTHIKQHWPEIVKTDFKFVGFDLSVSLLIRCESSSHIGLSRCQVSKMAIIPTGGRRKVYSICHASVKATQTEYHTTAANLGLRWRNNRDTPHKIVLHSWMMTWFWINRHKKFFDDFGVINGYWVKRHIIFTYGIAEG